MELEKVINPAVQRAQDSFLHFQLVLPKQGGMSAGAGLLSSEQKNAGPPLPRSSHQLDAVLPPPPKIGPSARG